MTEAAPYVAEYISRLRLAKLGFVTPVSELTAFKEEIFGIISVEIDKVQAEPTKKAAKRGR